MKQGTDHHADPSKEDFADQVLEIADCMASWMDITPMSTKKISLEELPGNVIKLQINRLEYKATYITE